MPMNLKDILDALKTATPEEREAFSKALAPGQAPATGGGLTKEQLDAHLEPFRKGAGTPADFSGAQRTAQLDVTGWLQQLTTSVVESNKAVTEALDKFAKGFVAYGEATLAIRGEVETMSKSLTAPGASAAVTRAAQLANGQQQFAKGHGANGGNGQGNGGMVEPLQNGEGRFANLTEAQVVDHLRVAMEAEQDPMRKSQIANALTQVELDYAITDDFFARLGIAAPAVA